MKFPSLEYQQPLDTSRKISLSDAVIGIAVTLLILEVKVPEDHSFSDDGLLNFLAKVGDQLLVCAVTFVLIGSYWMQHRRIVDHLKSTSAVIAWINLAFLFLISLTPFFASLLGAYPNDQPIVLLFGASHVLCGLSLTLMWSVATGLGVTNASHGVRNSILGGTLVSPAVCFLAVLLSFGSRNVAIAMFLSIPCWQLTYTLVAAARHTRQEPESLTDSPSHQPIT